MAITPLGRTGVPEDIGLIAAFLASDEARWLQEKSSLEVEGFVERTRVVSAFGSSLRRRR
jgi:NAD(P)-dependent dehydrogenase (short-subunit alcohol dehydrogenase family)